MHITEPAKPVLKEGYGWCMQCKVNQVKLPGALCEKCKKELE